jgi:hypothetical protein
MRIDLLCADWWCTLTGFSSFIVNAQMAISAPGKIQTMARSDGQVRQPPVMQATPGRQSMVQAPAAYKDHPESWQDDHPKNHQVFAVLDLDGCAVIAIW